MMFLRTAICVSSTIGYVRAANELSTVKETLPKNMDMLAAEKQGGDQASSAPPPLKKFKINTYLDVIKSKAEEEQNSDLKERSTVWGARKNAIEASVQKHGVTDELMRLIVEYSAPDATFLLSDEPRSVADCKEQLGYTVEATRCPWASPIKNLYASICITGEESWIPLMRNLAHTKGAKDFVIMTGRHGDLVTQFNKEGFMLQKDEEHTREDQRKTRLMRLADRNRVITIEVVDTTEVPRHHLEKLRYDVNNCINQGKIVILAWCYSLFCHEFGSWDNESFDGIMRLYQEREKMPIGDVMLDNADFFNKGNAYKWTNDDGKGKRERVQLPEWIPSGTGRRLIERLAKAHNM